MIFGFTHTVIALAGIGAAGGEQTVAGTAVAHSWPVRDTAMALVTTNSWMRDRCSFGS